VRRGGACNRLRRLAASGLVLAAVWALPVAAPGETVEALSDSPDAQPVFDLTVNAFEVANAATAGDLERLFERLDQRRRHTGGEIRAWVGTEVVAAAHAGDPAPQWTWPIIRSLAAHYRGDAQRALMLAQEAMIEPASVAEEAAEAVSDLPPVPPALWLAQLEIWPAMALATEAFAASRQRGRDRLEALRAAYPADQRVTALLAHAALADGDLAQALDLFGEAQAAGVELEPGWRERAMALEGWQPAFDAERLMTLRLDAERAGQTGIGTLGRVGDSDSPPIDALDLTAMPALHKLAAVADAALLDELLPTFADVNQSSPRGGAAYTPLHIAAELGNLAAIQGLVDQGAYLDRAADPQAALETIGRQLGAGVPGATPLHVAVAHGQGEAAGLLLQLGAMVNTVDRAGLSPLQTAGAMGEHDMVAALLAHGADARFQHDRWGDASDLARMFGQGEVAGTLDVARRTQQFSAAIGGATTMSAGTVAPYTMVAGTVLSLVGSPQGQQMLARGVVAASNDGSIVFRLGLGAGFLLLGTLFRYGPRLVGRLLLRLFSDGEAGIAASQGQSDRAGQAHLRASLGNRYRCRLRAPAFGLVDGSDVEVQPDVIKAHGYAARWNLAEGERFVRCGVKLGLFAIGLVLAVLFWAALVESGGGGGSLPLDFAGFVFMLVAVPALAFFSDGLATVLLTEPMTLELHADEIEQVSSGASGRGWEVVARLRKLGEGRGELIVSLSSAEDAQALARELSSMAHARPLAG